MSCFSAYEIIFGNKLKPLVPLQSELAFWQSLFGTIESALFYTACHGYLWVERQTQNQTTFKQAFLGSQSTVKSFLGTGNVLIKQAEENNWAHKPLYSQNQAKNAAQTEETKYCY